MRVRLAYKLFLMFFITSVVSIAFMVGVMRYFFERDFGDFVNKMEMEQLSEMVDKLGKAYQQKANWDFIAGRPQAFREMLRPDFTDKASHHPFPRPDDGHPPGERPVPPPMEPRPPLIEQRLTLFDAQQHIVVGDARSTRDHIMRPIVVGGKTVGWLGLRVRKALTNPLEQTFRRRQAWTFFIVGGAVLFLSALVSYLFARHLLQPVARLTHGAHALASRKFDTRIEVHTADELGQLANDFNRMAQTLDSYEQLRQQWISDISHELRTPLAILRGEIEAIQDGVREMTGGNLASLHAEVLHLEKLVNDLHELSLADTGVLSSAQAPVDVLAVLQESVDLFAPRFADASITLTLDPDPTQKIIMTGDADRLAQVFANLLENSLRYTRSPGQLRIWWKSIGQWLHLNFEDTMPGVPDEALAKVFDRLYRVDKSRARVSGGSGLGLAISKGIVEAFGGEIRASHSTMGGLRIEIVLPIRMPA